MDCQASALPVILLLVIVLAVLAISIYPARKASSAKGFFAAGGTIPWTVNGIAFAGDYLSAALLTKSQNAIHVPRTANELLTIFERHFDQRVRHVPT